MAIYKEDTNYGSAYGIEIERNGKTLHLMEVVDGGDPLGENLLATPFLNSDLKTVENVENEYIDFEKTDNKRCFFWEVVGNMEETRRNFEIACKHYHEIYGVRDSAFEFDDFRQ